MPVLSITLGERTAHHRESFGQISKQKYLTIDIINTKKSSVYETIGQKLEDGQQQNGIVFAVKGGETFL